MSKQAAMVCFDYYKFAWRDWRKITQNVGQSTVAKTRLELETYWIRSVNYYTN
jgi:hypothetical protein